MGRGGKTTLRAKASASSPESGPTTQGRRHTNILTVLYFAVSTFRLYNTKDNTHISNTNPGYHNHLVTICPLLLLLYLSADSLRRRSDIPREQRFQDAFAISKRNDPGLCTGSYQQPDCTAHRGL